MKLNLKTIVALISSAIVGLIVVQVIWINSAIEVRKSQFDEEVRGSLVEVTQQIPKVVRANQEAKFYQRQKQLDPTVTDINQLISAMLGNTPFQQVSEKITEKQLDSLIKNEMLKRGINTNYVFGVYDATTGVSLYEQDSMTAAFNKQLITKGINIQFFVDDFMLKQPFISIFFPKKNGYIFRKMFLILSISLLLILTVIYAFYFTVNTIYKQKQLSEIKNDFINNMTHELKTPISTIQLACEALTDSDMNSPESQGTFIEMIKDENARLKGLVDTVLKTAILDKGQVKLNEEPINLLDVLNRVKDNFSLKISQLGGEIKIENDLPELIFEGDNQHMTNVFQNLIDNAIKYSSEIPKITISTLKTINNYIVTVTDNGIGISRENLDKIFEKLYRVPTGDLHNVKGFGLGLNYVKSIVELHGGNITVKSTKYKGSSFIITLPLNK
ncbi:MAG: two-component system phosphate regulon sensor histidine kinase PhoR [Flavobacteriales bacterium]|jgi:two-component system phosphate regulon sensor histidine kinase PhoR|tara:strand:+ start:304 stop:1635 length:1332 start_codon:yes stop_codon:yes gene_type:complete